MNSDSADRGTAAPKREAFSIEGREALERNGKWSLVRRSVELLSFGANLVEIAPGESIPEHDEIDRDQEELFCFLTGDPLLVIEGVEYRVAPGSFARLDPELHRTVHNDGPAAASLLIVSAPRTSGYEPMSWA
jgi:uncharacterized cupin superfamily protein